ncbi:hypothetical protein WALBB_1100012 [Wolbachia pipientis wAlbB]|nr:hypothetical protein WALBB_1100012 [Wolbachia pipientis wAlbB]
MNSPATIEVILLSGFSEDFTGIIEFIPCCELLKPLNELLPGGCRSTKITNTTTNII